MIVCINAYCRFCACLVHICRVSDAQLRLIPQQIGQEFGHCLFVIKPVNSTSENSFPGVHLQALSLLSGRSDSALMSHFVHHRVRDRTDEAHVDSEAEAKDLML